MERMIYRKDDMTHLEKLCRDYTTKANVHPVKYPEGNYVHVPDVRHADYVDFMVELSKLLEK